MCLKLHLSFLLFPPCRRLTASITWVNKQNYFLNLYLNFKGTEYNLIENFWQPQRSSKSKKSSTSFSPQTFLSPISKSHRGAQYCQHQWASFHPHLDTNRPFFCLKQRRQIFSLKVRLYTGGAIYSLEKTVQGSCQQFLQNHFREAVCQVDKRMKKWRNAKGRERKKQPQSNSAYASGSFKRINIHVSISNHCTVIINCFAAKLYFPQQLLWF